MTDWSKTPFGRPMSDEALSEDLLKEAARKRWELTPADARFGCCQEAALGLSFYAPCNKAAIAIVGWRGRRDEPIRMCMNCLIHNVKNRGGEVIRYVEDWTAEEGNL